MASFESKDYKAFDLFNHQWGLATAGTPDAFNACTIAWGSLGTIWGGPGEGRPIVTIYINPARYTWQFLKDSDTFTVSFFPEKYRDALMYLGTHSGRDSDKIGAVGLSPLPMGESVAYLEANLTFLCKKIYQGSFKRAGMAPEIVTFADSMGLPPHWFFMGEVLDVRDKR